jgi:alcohol dehydrogenase (cytochrome c)
MKTLLAIFFALLFIVELSAQLTYDRVRQAVREPGSWLTYHGTYDAQRFSALDEINRANVQQLHPVWMYQVQGRHHFETTPLVFDGVMYLTDPPSDVVALDVKTGRPLWSYRRSLPDDLRACCGNVNRGVAALGDQIFVATIDAHLVALDMRTGRVRWDVEVADYKTGHSLTAAPLAVKDKVIVGMAGAEYGVRGFLDAYDAATGKRAWRLWTVPGPGEPGNHTWSGDSWMHGGATTWVTGAFDPETNLLYWGTGNPGPDYIGDVRAGDNLYSDSLIAVNVDTGALTWHFQFTPHDVNDIDATEIPILIDADFRGRLRKLLLFANRNGFFYIFDRVTGEFLHAKAFARQTWTKGLDAKGRPIPNPDAVPSSKGALVYPDDDGVTNWFSPSYSPQTKTFYQNVREKGGIYYRNEAVYQPGRMYLGASKRAVPDEEAWGALRALDPLTGDVKWEFRVATPPWCGLLSTAGGLVFSGTMEGMFFAVDAESGKPLWRFQTGGAIWSNPISYQAGGHQYVAIAAGNALIVFGLQASGLR